MPSRWLLCRPSAQWYSLARLWSGVLQRASFARAPDDLPRLDLLAFFGQG